MQTLTVEYLSSYKKYRLWNSDIEDWFTNKKDLIRVCKNNKFRFNYVTYGTDRLIKDFAKNDLTLTKGR